MATRKRGKSWSSIETQANDIYSALMSAYRNGRISKESLERRMETMENARARYQSNIENSARYKDLMKQSQAAKEWRYDPLMESGAYYSTEKSRKLFNQADDTRFTGYQSSSTIKALAVG